MTTLTIEVPDDLMEKLAQRQEPIQEMVIAILKDAFDNGRETSLFDESSEEYAVRHLYQMGFLSETENGDDPLANEWDGLPEEEKQMHLQEVESLMLKDSALSRYIIENRR